MPVDTFGDGRTAVANQTRDVFKVDIVGAQQANERVAQLPGRPFLAQVRRLSDQAKERRTLCASNGVPTAEAKTRP